jgi:hypothetical protein
MKWMRGYAGLMLLILAAYLYAEYKRPPRVDWTVTLDRYDRIPFGTYILYDRLNDLFDVKPVQPDGTVYERYHQRTDTGELSIFINQRFKTSPVDDASLLYFVSLGNTIFLATEDISAGLADSLGLELKNYRIRFTSTDTIHLNLEAPILQKPDGYAIPTAWGMSRFTAYDSARTTVLGRDLDEHANFIQIQVGKGSVFIHSVPTVFSNISMLSDDNAKYVSDVLSYLPKHPSRLVWDEYFSSGRSGATTPLRVILMRPALRAGYFTALTAVLLFLLFRSKRRQRIIPVITPPRNTTMEFVDTVGQLYLNKRDHRDLALKLIQQFLEHVREQHRLHTGMLDAEFSARLALRTGMAPDRTKAFIDRLNKLRSGDSVSESDLLTLSRDIDAFKHSGT